MGIARLHVNFACDVHFEKQGLRGGLVKEQTWVTSPSVFRGFASFVFVILPAQRSDYRKYRPGQFIRIRLKIEQNCGSFSDIFSSAIMNDLSMTFITRLNVDAKCVYQQRNWIIVANYFGTPPAD